MYTRHTRYKTSSKPIHITSHSYPSPRFSGRITIITNNPPPVTKPPSVPSHPRQISNQHQHPYSHPQEQHQHQHDQHQHRHEQQQHLDQRVILFGPAAPTRAGPPPPPPLPNNGRAADVVSDRCAGADANAKSSPQKQIRRGPAYSPYRRGCRLSPGKRSFADLNRKKDIPQSSAEVPQGSKPLSLSALCSLLAINILVHRQCV